MNHETFERLVDEINEHDMSILFAKNKEYANDTDKLRNFKLGGEMAGMTPQQVLWSYMMKHMVSVRMIVDGESNYDCNILREKCGDIRNYLRLLEAIFDDDFNNRERVQGFIG